MSAGAVVVKWLITAVAAMVVDGDPMIVDARSMLLDSKAECEQLATDMKKVAIDAKSVANVVCVPLEFKIEKPPAPTPRGGSTT